MRHMPRESLHIEPQGVIATARHYVRDLIYGANDGIITTRGDVARLRRRGCRAAVAVRDAALKSDTPARFPRRNRAAKLHLSRGMRRECHRHECGARVPGERLAWIAV